MIRVNTEPLVSASSPWRNNVDVTYSVALSAGRQLPNIDCQQTAPTVSKHYGYRQRPNSNNKLLKR